MRKSVLILDVDNTLNTVDPEPFVQKGLAMGIGRWGDARQWDLYEPVVVDLDVEPHPAVQKWYKLLHSQYDHVAIITGRKDTLIWRAHTEAWLQKWRIKHDELVMRPAGELHMTGGEYKAQEALRILDGADMLRSVAIDDDLAVLAEYRDIGLRTFAAPHEWDMAVEFHLAGRREHDLRKLEIRP